MSLSNEARFNRIKTVVLYYPARWICANSYPTTNRRTIHRLLGTCVALDTGIVLDDRHGSSKYK